MTPPAIKRRPAKQAATTATLLSAVAAPLDFLVNSSVVGAALGAASVWIVVAVTMYRSGRMNRG